MWSSSKLIVIGIILYGVFLDIMIEVDANCVCNAKGTDYCSGGCKSAPIVRPKPKYYDTTPDINLNPIGDSCWCSKLAVEPAALPKPCPKRPAKPPTYSCKCKTEHTYEALPIDYAAKPKPFDYASKPLPSFDYITKPEVIPATFVYEAPNYAYDNYVPKETRPLASPPADPVSVSLALQAEKAIAVPEAKVSYGFQQKPIDMPKPVVVSNVPEENLFKLNSDVIIMKKLSAPTLKKYDEDDLVDEIDEEPADELSSPPVITYKQLGYQTEYYKNPKFRKLSPSYYVRDSYEQDDYVTGYAKIADDDCGFKPGRIAAGYRKKSCHQH